MADGSDKDLAHTTSRTARGTRKQSVWTAESKALNIALGQCIRQRRLFLGMTQTQVADAIGVRFQQIQKYETGVNRLTATRLIQIARALGWRAADLIGNRDIDAMMVSQPSLPSSAIVANINLICKDLPADRQRLILTIVRGIKHDAEVEISATED